MDWKGDHQDSHWKIIKKKTETGFTYCTRLYTQKEEEIEEVQVLISLGTKTIMEEKEQI